MQACYCFQPGPWQIQMATESLSEEVIFKLDWWDEREPAMWSAGEEWCSRQKEVACETEAEKSSCLCWGNGEERRAMCLGHNELGRGCELRLGLQHLGFCRLWKELVFYFDHCQTAEEVLLLVITLLVVALTRDKKSDNERLLSTYYIQVLF